MDKQSLLFLAIANRAYGGDSIVLDMLRVLLERNELVVQIELVPESEIVEIARQLKPVLILAGYRQIDPDDSMPLVGDAAIKVLKSDPDTCDIPILLLEAIPDIDDIARECGVDAYISLPWGARDIYPAVLELIGRDT